MKELMLCGHPVRVDDQDYFCLTDIWKALGSIDKLRPKFFFKNDKTREYIKHLEKGGYPPFYTIRGRNGGTYACRHMAYEFGGWANPEFKEFVYTILDAYYSGDLKTEHQWQMQSDLQQFAIDEGISKGKGTVGSHMMHQRRREKHELERRAIFLLKKYQLELFNDQGVIEC